MKPYARISLLIGCMLFATITLGFGMQEKSREISLDIRDPVEIFRFLKEDLPSMQKPFTCKIIEFSSVAEPEDLADSVSRAYEQLSQEQQIVVDDEGRAKGLEFVLANKLSKYLPQSFVGYDDVQDSDLLDRLSQLRSSILWRVRSGSELSSELEVVSEDDLRTFLNEVNRGKMGPCGRCTPGIYVVGVTFLLISFLLLNGG